MITEYKKQLIEKNSGSGTFSEQQTFYSQLSNKSKADFDLCISHVAENAVASVLGHFDNYRFFFEDEKELKIYLESEDGKESTLINDDDAYLLDYFWNISEEE